jgi:2-haloacid dehalogenase
VAARWATFDCYGTLIDWNAGIRGELERLFGPAQGARLLGRYHALEPQVQGEAFRSYAGVLRETLARLAAEEGTSLPAGEADALARSLPGWPPFPEAPAALRELRRRGWSLAILSNSDSDLIAASQQRLGVPFDGTVVAEEIESYKPAHRHWERFFELTGADPKRHVHVAQSHFHDIVPSRELGLTCVWINRLGEHAEPAPDREQPDLSSLPDTLDELVPARAGDRG